MSEQQRRVKYEITFTPRIKITTVEFAVGTLILGVVSFIFLFISFLTSKCFTQYSDTALVSGLASVPFIAMALVCVGYVKLLTLKDGKPSCRLPWWPECMLPQDVKPIEEEVERPSTFSYIDIIGRIEMSMTSHLARFRNILPTDRTSADFDDIPTDSSHRRRPKLSEVESAEEPSSQDVISSDEVFLPADDSRESEDSITSGPAGDGKRQQPDERLSKSLVETRVAYKKGDKGGKRQSPEGRAAISVHSLESRVDRKRDSSAISALPADESNKRSKPDKQFSDIRHPLEPFVVIKGSEWDVKEPHPVSFDKRTKPPTAYVISVHIPDTDSECSSSCMNPAHTVRGENDLEFYVGDGRKSEPDASHDSSADVLTTEATELLPSCPIREVEVCGEHPPSEQSVGDYGELKHDTSCGRSENVATANVELPSSCEISQDVVCEHAVPEQMPGCADRVNTGDGPDSPIKAGIGPYSVLKFVDLKTASILSTSAPAIPAAVQKHERKDSKRTISECRLAKIGVISAEDASAKETCASEESQKIESGFETTDNGETRASGSLSVECKQSSVDSGAVGVSSGTPLSSEESNEPAESAHRGENIG